MYTERQAQIRTAITQGLELPKDSASDVRILQTPGYPERDRSLNRNSITGLPETLMLTVMMRRVERNMATARWFRLVL